MFEVLTKGFRSARARLSGKQVITETAIDEALRDIRVSLLEADVALHVVNAFLAQVKEKAIGEVVQVKAKKDGRKVEITPAEHFVKLCNDELVALMGAGERGIEFEPGGRPTAVMMVGLHGTGKTTTIGKMAHFYKNRGKKLLLAAGDTYRAAGMDQLAIWGERVGVPVVVGKPGQDPASVMFDAGKQALEQGVDLLIADTAGRLHTNVNLVDELKKVHRVLGKAVPGGPHEVLLLLDSTMGQNAVRQADVFRQAVDVTGIALAKLDGTAKGGVVLSIARDMGLPIRFVGVGEGIDDIRPFDAKEFTRALFQVD